MRHGDSARTGSCRSNEVTVENGMNHHLACCNAHSAVPALSTMGYHQLDFIPLNPTPGSKWTASDPEDEREFVRRLQARGVPTTVRDTRGREIDGACGQLAALDQ